jgi:hypothetical protein
MVAVGCVVDDGFHDIDGPRLLDGWLQIVTYQYKIDIQSLL